MSDVAVRVKGLGKRYYLGPSQGRAAYKSLRESLVDAVQAPLRRLRNGSRQTDAVQELWALRDVSFELRHGEVLGIIGRNGAGKSTLLKILARITEPTTGRAEVHGRVGSLLEVGTGFHPELTGRENIYLNGTILGMSKDDIGRKFDEIVAFAELEAFLDTPVKRYSSGMYMRLAFSVAAHLDPEILVVDEVLAVGDTKFQQKCLKKMSGVASEGRTILFVSHNMSAVSALCGRAVLLAHGKIADFGGADEVIRSYLVDLGDGLPDVVLSRRLDRTGSGEVQFCRFTIEDDAGRRAEVLQSGKPASFILHARSTTGTPIDNVSLYLAVGSIRDVPLFLQSNLFTGEPVTISPDATVVACHIPRLPLAEGTYRVHLGAKIGTTVVDHLTDVAQFQVAEGDYYGSGHQGGPGFPILVDARWQTMPVAAAQPGNSN
ncbi:MAG: ABC transporter ATP-binding protein [Chloroflexi bacterium]|nr:ABC transporter ATP-binding protein [Chloroflexota bacterium]